MDQAPAYNFLHFFNGIAIKLKDFILKTTFGFSNLLEILRSLIIFHITTNQPQNPKIVPIADSCLLFINRKPMVVTVGRLSLLESVY